MARVLIVEDDSMSREIYSKLLGEAFSIEAVGTLREAVNLLEICHFDLALLDLRLPDSDIHETVAVVKRCSPRLAIVVITGFSNPEVTRQCILDTAGDVLIKGVDDLNQEAFVNRIRSAMATTLFVQEARAARKEVRNGYN